MIRQIIQKQVCNSLKKLYAIEVEDYNSVELQPTKKEFEGDITLVVFPYLKQAKVKPEVLADSIGQEVEQEVEYIKSYNVVKGFLNFVISDRYWLEFLQDHKDDERYGFLKPRQEKPIVIEYSSPNTNKPLHLGHVRNNLLGWSVSQILKANGYDVKMVNLVNDRGIHICKSMVAWQMFANNDTPQSSGIKGDHFVGNYYVLFDKEYKQEVEHLIQQGMTEEQAKKEAPIMKQAQRMLVQWENNDEEVRSLWSKMNGWVYEGFDKTYKRLGIHFDKVYYESQTYLLGKDLVERGLKEGVFFKKDDGSVWVDLQDDGLDEKLLLRSDGTSVYMTQDLGTACLRHNDFDSKRLMYVVGNEQIYHFKVLKLVLQKLGFDWAKDIYHLSYGMVELPNGKMKSREGTVVDADDLMQEMYEQAKLLSEQRGEEGSRGKKVDMDDKEADELYNMLALGALKYFILKVDPSKNMLFNPQESIDFNGNTGPFIQYTHARICSIISKAEQMGINIKDVHLDTTLVLNSKEKEVLKTISSFGSVIQEAGKSFSPSLIANYVYGLAKLFNAFYQDCSILKEQDENVKRQRVCLAYLTSVVIRNAMYLLGIDVPQRM